MPRKPRFKVPGMSQHVIQRGNNRQACFYGENDYYIYLDALLSAIEKYQCEIHAYVLMTNHVHLLVTPLVTGAIANVMQSVGRRYVRYVNNEYHRTGTLWEGRYKASLIQSVDYLLVCYRYIELNPVRAGMVEHPGEYRWSSYAANGQGQVDPLISPHMEYLRLEEDSEPRLTAYRELFRQHLDLAQIDEIRASLNHELVFGSSRFKDEIEIMTGRRSRTGKPGRPKRE